MVQNEYYNKIYNLQNIEQNMIYLTKLKNIQLFINNK